MKLANALALGRVDLEKPRGHAGRHEIDPLGGDIEQLGHFVGGEL